jgi:hypothetical protein
MRCANSACSRLRPTKLLGRFISGGGVTRDNRWYCSQHCYHDAVLSDYYSRKINGSELRTSAYPVTARSIGAVLQRMGKINWLQLEEALEDKRRNGEMPMVHYLIQRGMVDRRDILEALGRHHKVPVALVGSKRLSPELTAMIPSVVARTSGVLPLSYSAKKRRISLVMKDPSDLTTVTAIRSLLECNVQTFQGDPAEIDRLLSIYYPPEELRLPKTAVSAAQQRLAVAH